MSEAGSRATNEVNDRPPRTNERYGVSIVLATAVHAVVATAFLHALTAPRDLDWLFTARARAEPPSGRLRYFDIQPGPAASVAWLADTPSSPAVAIEQSSEAVPARAAGPTAMIDSPGAAATPALHTESGKPGTGTETDRGNTGVVLVPGSADPRIWSVPASTGVVAPLHADVLAGTLARAIRASNDSIAAAGVQTFRPDVIVAARDGRKYGIDNSRIHLGAVSLPAVLLGALPIAGFGCMPTLYFPDRPVRDSAGIACLQLENSTVAERNRRINEMSAEIRARAPVIEGGREEIARIAARKDRARATRMRAKAGPPADNQSTRPR